MAPWASLIACVVGAISILGTIITVTTVIIQMRSTIVDLKDRDTKREVKEAAIDKQVIDLLVSFKEFVGAQSELNITVKAFMEAQTNINERMLSQVASMTKATTEGSQVISLLTEVLKRKKMLTDGSEQP